jgi:uncharacterized repeat protein (TIGR01451 family)
MAVRFALALVGLLLVVPAGAPAAVRFGADLTLTPDATPGCCDATLGSPTAPVSGVLVRWTVRTGTTASVAPAVYRGGLQSNEPATTVTAPLTTVELRVPIRTGDQLGMHRPTAGTMPQAVRSGSGAGTLLVSGVIEADADNDGYGDESQDACPNEASLHVAPCHADIALTMTGPTFAVLDRDTPYVVTVVNHGPSAAAGLTLTDAIPAGARFVRVDGATSCTPGATVGCALPDVPGGATRAFTVVLAGTAEGARLTHTVSVATTSTDATPGDHAASVDTLITGTDDLAPGTGRDRVWGGPGNDTIAARDGSRDVIDCGAGLDRVTADRRDRVRGCERVSRR